MNRSMGKLMNTVLLHGPVGPAATASGIDVLFTGNGCRFAWFLVMIRDKVVGFVDAGSVLRPWNIILALRNTVRCPP